MTALFALPPSCFRRHPQWAVIFLSASALLGSASATAQVPEEEDLSPHSDVELIADVASFRAGEPFTIALRLALDPDWHTYWVNGGDAGLPLNVQWTLPAGFEIGPLQWPGPKKIALPPFMSYGYENELIVLAEVTPPTQAPGTADVRITALADWLVCEEVCLPAMGEATIALTVAEEGMATAPSTLAVIAEARSRIPLRPRGWVTRAWTVEEGYVLEVVPRTDDELPAPYFYAEEYGLLEHAASQRVVRDGGAIRLLVPRSPFADSGPAVLRGVLEADATVDHGQAWSVEFELDAASGRSLMAETASFLAPGVQLTGGVSASSAITAAPTPTGLGGMSLSLALGFAVLGGLLLNLMPCVFPVIGVKVLGFVRHGGANPQVARRHGLVFASGVLISLWLLAAGLLTLRATGENLGWGFQLQSPEVVALFALLLFALALNLLGVFEIGIGLTRLGMIGSGSGYRDSFLTGALTVLVATPCTAPFMGAALGYALVQPPFIALAVFTGLAVGLSAPYVVLSSAPVLLRRLPPAGPWMVTLKQFLAFPLFLSVVWLVWVLARQVGSNAVAALLLGMTLIGFAAWVAVRPGVQASRPIRLLSAGAAALALIVPLAVAHGSPRQVMAVATGGALAWEPFSTERLAELRAEGRPVFLDFTAAWCLSCQVNERVAFRSGSVVQAFAEAEVALLRADWTNRDPDIAALLKSFGRSGVPLNVLYPSGLGQAPEILPALLTPGVIVKAIEDAAASSARS